MGEPTETMDYSYIDANVAAIRARVNAAKKEKTPVMLAAVKYADLGEINHLISLGVHDLGENRVQQLLERWDGLDKTDLRMHFIGKLQSNKVKYVIDKVVMIHSLDSETLAKEIEKQAAKIGKTMDVLVEINAGDEESKTGMHLCDVPAFCASLSAYPHLCLRGFMVMTPIFEKKADYLKIFSEISAQCLDIWQKTLHNIGEPLLSMGMSDSFEAAIEAGADVVRIGRALFLKPDV